MKRQPTPRQVRIAGTALFLFLLGLTSATSAGGIHGRVFALDESGRHIGMAGGATLEFRGVGSAVAGAATADADGYYRVQLAPGQYTFKITAPGFKDEDEGRGFALQRSDRLVARNFSLTRGPNDPDQTRPELPRTDVGRLVGRVVEKTPRGMVGVPGAVVHLRQQGLPGVTRVVTRQSDVAGTNKLVQDRMGGFQIHLPAGEWRAAVTADGFETLADPQPIMSERDQTAEREFVLVREQPQLTGDQGIRGQVSLLDREGHAVRKPIPVTVSIMPMPQRDAATAFKADAAGDFERQLSAGAYHVTAAADGFRLLRPASADVLPGTYDYVKLVLVSQESRPATEQTFVATVLQETIKGRIPVRGAEVMVRLNGRPLSEALRGVADADGRVTFRISQPGDYATLARLEGYQPAGRSIVVRAGETAAAELVLKLLETQPGTTTGEETLSQAFPYRSFVVCRDGNEVVGVPGAQLTFAQSGQERQVATSAGRGAFSVTLTEGSCIVQVKAPQGFEDSTQKLLVRRDAQAEYIYVTRSPSVKPIASRDIAVQGYVVERSSKSSTGNAGLKDSQLVWQPRTTKGRRAVLQSGDLGRFSVELPPDTYDVDVKPAIAGFKALRQTVRVEAGMQATYFIMERTPISVPPQRVKVEGIVVARSSQSRMGQTAVPGATLSITPSAGNGQAQTVTSDSRGHFELSLAIGAYRVRIQAPRGLADKTETLNVQTGLGSQRFVLEREQAGSGGEKGESNNSTDDRPGNATLTIRVAERAKVGTRMLAGAEVSVTSRNRKVATSRTDKPGSATMQVPPGEYDVTVMLSGYEAGRQRVVVTPKGSTATILLTRKSAGNGATGGSRGGRGNDTQGGTNSGQNSGSLGTAMKPAQLSLTVAVSYSNSKGGRAHPIANAQVVVLQAGQRRAAAKTDASGNGRVTLPPGRYDIQVTAADFQSRKVSVNLTESETVRVSLETTLQ
jgi:hypothetical protein